MLKAENIHLNLGGFSLKDVTFNVNEGEYVVLLGPTGTGKTVLLETIAGHHIPEKGRIILLGKDVTRLPPEKRGLGVVYQDYALFPHLSVFENIAFGLRMRGKSGDLLRNPVRETAEFLEIDHLLSRGTIHLSGGERQRVALARAMVLRPSMLLLDEPLSAIDRSTRDRLQRELKSMHEKTGITTLHITHDLNEAFFLGDRLIVIKEGEVLQEGSPDEVLIRPVNRFVAVLLGIRNFVPCYMGENGDLKIKGDAVAIEPVFLDNITQKNSRIYLTVPDWAVEIGSQGDCRKSIWRGKFRVKTMNATDGHFDVELEHDSGILLHTSLSRREIKNLEILIGEGCIIEAGICSDGVYWIPG